MSDEMVIDDSLDPYKPEDLTKMLDAIKAFGEEEPDDSSDLEKQHAHYVEKYGKAE